MGAHDMPAAEVGIDADLVSSLVADQYPPAAGLPVTPLATGWDNELFVVGDDLVARLPRRAMAVPLVESEHRWLPLLGPRLPLPIPVPVHQGTPGRGYRWPWSICPYLPGRSALSSLRRGLDFVDPEFEARRLARFLDALHEPAPHDAPRNPFRGVPLVARSTQTRQYLGRLAGDDDIDVPAAAAEWAAALELPPWTGPGVWVHGDLHPGNVLMDGGAISGIIDFGDLTAGDPATDLAAAWMLFDGDARAAFVDQLRPDEATWARARAWALAFGLAITASSADNPDYDWFGRRAIAVVLDAPQ